MPMKRTQIAIVPILLLLTVIGCSDTPDMRDQRLAEFAQQAVKEQARQNDRMADQSQAIVEESHQLAQTAKELVESDAEARRELIAAQQELTSQVNDQQATVDAGREQLEQDRREIAEQRHRDPIVATAIQNIGLTLACLLPLIVAVYVIRQMQSQDPDHAAVAEMLVLEVTSDEPRLLPGPQLRPRKLTHEDESAQHALITGDSTNAVEPPS
ncbi:MAG: hypothetical protein CMJ78_00360 [Planctomycetaceae bacterium]|nr:hypothetical protein [Planctomycetaceae bacterium]